MKTLKTILVSSLFLSLSSGCALYQMVNGDYPGYTQKKESLRDKHNSYLGSTEDDLVENLGAPEKVETVGSYKIYYYITDHGFRNRGVAYSSGYSSRTTHEYQMSRFYLKDGKVVKWDYE